jgi:hypothetical protein
MEKNTSSHQAKIAAHWLGLVVLAEIGLDLGRFGLHRKAVVHFESQALLESFLYHALTGTTL